MDRCRRRLLLAHTSDNTHVLRGTTMHDLEVRLDPARFQRVHRSTIVNLARVKECDRIRTANIFSCSTPDTS